MLGCPPPQETYRDDLFPGGMGGARRVPEAFAPSFLRGERPYHPTHLRSPRAILACAPARALLRVRSRVGNPHTAILCHIGSETTRDGPGAVPLTAGWSPSSARSSSG